MTLLARPVDGGLEGVDVVVAGVVRAAYEENQRRAVLVDLRLARRLLRMEGRATEILVGVEPLSRAHQAAAVIEARLKVAGVHAEARPWDEINPRYQAARVIWRTSLGVTFFAVLLVASLGLSTTLVLIVRERAREVATLCAIGLGRGAILVVFGVEGAMLGAVGGTLGAAVALLMTSWLRVRGLTFVPPGGFPVTVRPYVEAPDLVLAVGVAALLAAIVALIPAWRATRRSPAELLR